MSDESDDDAFDREAFVNELAASVSGAYDVGEEFASAAGERGADLRADNDLDISAADLVDRMAEAPYDDVERRWNWAVGDVCAASEDCKDSRPYRAEGFGEVGPSGEW